MYQSATTLRHDQVQVAAIRICPIVLHAATLELMRINAQKGVAAGMTLFLVDRNVTARTPVSYY